MPKPYRIPNQCKGLCRTEFGGIKRFVSPKTHPGISMYMLGFCFCNRCQLFFTPQAQIVKGNGHCKCCKTRLRTRPTTGRQQSKIWQKRRDATRIS